MTHVRFGGRGWQVKAIQPRPLQVGGIGSQQSLGWIGELTDIFILKIRIYAPNKTHLPARIEHSAASSSCGSHRTQSPPFPVWSQILLE